MNHSYLVDSHCHFFHIQNFKKCIPYIQKKNIRKILIPSIHIQDSYNNVAFAQKYSFVQVAVGIHPYYIPTSCPTEQLVHLCQQNKVIAIGEIGLDETSPFPLERQKKIFIEQLQIAQKFQLPVLIHCRQYFGQLLEILQQYYNPRGGILHSWSGSWEIADLLIRKNYFIGVSPAFTNPNAKKRKSVIQKIPLQHIILETDSPYIPCMKIPKNYTTPLQILEVVHALATIKQTTFSHIATETSKNYFHLFNNT
ncbi:MAG: TatD family hydrolase [Planctomycetes bacterium]|nr:TatD family hydrolase [Planctomycetota bacterium]HPY74591.1 TatD family hydrolase [Planctomycetota bacterium]HQB00231.1 TatD family hydrolase [Planctomycetota bacterium]